MNEDLQVYVSSSTGSDDNDGLSEGFPLKTIEKAIEKGSTIFLKRGDVFYESISLKDCNIFSYGEGNKPIICGYRRINGIQWEEAGDNIWRICLTGKSFSGFEVEGSSMLNNIGCLHEYVKDLVHGKRVRYKADLKEDWDFWQTSHHKKKDVSPSDYDTLYLYQHSNPNELDLEYSVGTAAVKLKNGEINGIRIEGFGFGISALTKSIVRNCEIDAMGGMQIISDDVFGSYGNGLEIWITEMTENCLVENNIISRCYDCGCSIQGRIGWTNNILIRKNVIMNCCQAWEDFYTNDNPEMVFRDCIFEDNIVLNSGNTSGFGYSDGRFKYCHVLGNNGLGNKGMIFRNNIFIGGNYYCSGSFQNEYKSNIWNGNTCIIKRGDFILSNYRGTKDVIRIPTEKGVFPSIKAATEDAIHRYRLLTGDYSTKFIIKKDKVINKKISKYKKKYAVR